MKVTQLMLSTATALVAAIGVSTVSEAITILHSPYGSDLHYQQRGSYFPSVGKLHYTDYNNQQSTCSGTLISSQWVLTAAHCTENLNLYSSNNFNIGQYNYWVTQKVTHPDWFNTGGNPYAGWDIGLIKLHTHVWDVSPAIRFGGFNEVGNLGTHVGFGDTGTGLTGSTVQDNLKRGADNMVDAVGSVRGWSDRLLLADFDHPWGGTNSLGYSTPLPLEGSTAPGDSGGGLFINGYLAGVTSFGYALDGFLNSDYGDLLASTRVSPFNSWINSVISGQAFASSGFTGSYSNNSNQGVFFAAEVASTSVPEPSSLVSLGIFLLLGLFGLSKKGKQED
ncbi:MAG: trypsin-like serine protease [Crocosphaera sp.]